MHPTLKLRRAAERFETERRPLIPVEPVEEAHAPLGRAGLLRLARIVLRDFAHPLIWTAWHYEAGLSPEMAAAAYGRALWWVSIAIKLREEARALGAVVELGEVGDGDARPVSRAA